MDIVEIIREYVEEECKKPSSKYGYEPYQFHFVSVVRYADSLAIKLGADREIVAIAAWLHDIGSIIGGRANHHITGAKIAEEKLREFDYPVERIERIKKCISNHRGSTKHARDSLEEQIIAEADVLSNFENIGGLFKAAYEFESLSQDEAQKSVKRKLQNKYEQLHFVESRKLIKPKYEAAMLLLG
jgi:uncharacterized protein